MRNRLQLTGLGEALTKAAQEKLEQEDDLFFEDLTCEDGRTREQYESLGIKIPKDLIDKEKAFDKEFDLDYELIEFPCTIYEEEIVGFLESKEKTTIYTKNSLAFSVKEKVSEINEKINAFYLQDKR